MSNFQRTLGYMRPAGQTTSPLPEPAKITLPSGVQVQIPAGVTPASTNTQGQLVDANGAVILDTSGNPIQVSQPQQVLPAPTSTTPVASTAVSTAQHVGRRLIPVLTTVLVVGGAAYLGSYYGAKKAARRHMSSRRS